MLALPDPAVDDRNTVGFGIAADATTETTRHPHQMGVIQRIIRPSQLPPPSAEPRRHMRHAEITIQNDSVDAIVAACEEILVKVGESVCHSAAKVPPYHQPVQLPAADS